jgi:hypothetical protein
MAYLGYKISCDNLIARDCKGLTYLQGAVKYTGIKTLYLTLFYPLPPPPPLALPGVMALSLSASTMPSWPR